MVTATARTGWDGQSVWSRSVRPCLPAFCAEAATATASPGPGAAGLPGPGAAGLPGPGAAGLPGPGAAGPAGPGAAAGSPQARRASLPIFPQSHRHKGAGEHGDG